MTNTLVVKSSILGPHSQSNQLINQALEGKSNLIQRDLAATPLPVLDMNVATALRSDGNDCQMSLKQYWSSLTS